MFSILYYSATGNTLHLAQKLNMKLGSNCSEIINISTTKPEKLESKEHLVIMYSIHAFNAPKEMVQFIKQIPNGIYKKVSIIAVGCNDMWINEASSMKLRNILNEKGYIIALDRILAMPVTIVAKTSYDINSNIIKKAENDIIQIGDELLNGVKDSKIIPFKSKLIANIGGFEKHAVKLFGLELYANKECISCGKCWRECPANNIHPNKNNKPKFKLNCSMCMKCIYDCPTKSINPRFAKFLPIKGGYSIKDYL